MVRYQVKISEEAKQSLVDFYTWLRENESEVIASKVRSGLLDSIESLALRPDRNGFLTEMIGSEIEYRRILKWSYKIIFTIKEDHKEVIVVDVIHARRSPKYIQNKLQK